MGWVLFVDESGDFDSASATVCAGGVLTPDDLLRIDRATWRTALGKVVWAGSWPPHACELNQTGGVVAAWLQSQGAWQVPGIERAQLEAAEAVLTGSAQPKVGPFLRIARKGAMPDWELRAAATAALAQRPELQASLRQAVQSINARMASLVRGLDRALGRRLLVPLAFDVRGGSGAVRHARYELVLEALITRACMVLASTSDDVPLELVVATRGVWRESDTHHPEAQLSRADVEQCVGRAQQSLRAMGLGHVVLTARDPVPYDATTPPGVVLADWITNQARRIVGHQPWGALSRELPNGLGGNVEAYVAPLTRLLPTVTTARLERDVLVDRRPPPPGPPWAAAVARLWSQALDGRRS